MYAVHEKYNETNKIDTESIKFRKIEKIVRLPQEKNGAFLLSEVTIPKNVKVAFLKRPLNQ